MKNTIAEENQTLFKETLQLHHEAEAHSFGAAMSKGELSEQQWADWMGALTQLYVVIDPYLPDALKRTRDLFNDLLALSSKEIYPRYSYHADDVAGMIADGATNVGYVAGMCYILAGANLRGGQIVRKAVEKRDFPCSHLMFNEEDVASKEAAMKWLDNLRASTGTAVIKGAQDAFADMIDIMEEIWDNSNKE